MGDRNGNAKLPLVTPHPHPSLEMYWGNLCNDWKELRLQSKEDGFQTLLAGSSVLLHLRNLHVLRVLRRSREGACVRTPLWPTATLALYQRSPEAPSCLMYMCWVLAEACLPSLPLSVTLPLSSLPKLSQPLKAQAHGGIHQETKFRVQADCRTPSARCRGDFWAFNEGRI